MFINSSKSAKTISCVERCYYKLQLFTVIYFRTKTKQKEKTISWKTSVESLNILNFHNFILVFLNSLNTEIFIDILDSKQSDERIDFKIICVFF